MLTRRPLAAASFALVTLVAALLLIIAAREGAVLDVEAPSAPTHAPRPTAPSAVELAQGGSSATPSEPSPAQRSVAVDLTPTEPAAQTRGRLKIRVVGPLSTAVSGTQVTLGGVPWNGVFDDDGVCDFGELEARTYEFHHIGDPGLRGLMNRPCVGSWMEDYRDVEVVAGTTTELEMHFPDIARVFGTVVRTDGSPFEGASVQLRGGVAGAHRTYDGRCDRDGGFSIVACPGVYRLFVFWKSELGRDDDVHPPRARIELAPGDPQQHDVVIGPGGPGALSGIVVNQDGTPCDDVVVECRYWRPYEELGPGEAAFTLIDRASRTRTDASGRFAFRGLHLERYQVVAAAEMIDFHGPKPVSRFRKYAPHVDVVLTEADAVRDLGRIVVEESRPYAVTVRLRIDEAWLAKTREGMEALRIELRDGERPVEGPEKSRVRRDGDLVTWWCETPRGPVDLVVSDRAGRRRSLLLDPDTVRSEERELAFP